MKHDKDRVVEKLMQEHHRGSLTLVVLSVLRQEHYGYALVSHLSEVGLEITGDTLYPLLRRLEQQGLLSSQWSVDDSRPRKYYRTSEFGSVVYKALSARWLDYTDTVRRILA